MRARFHLRASQSRRLAFVAPDPVRILCRCASRCCRPVGTASPYVVRRRITPTKRGANLTSARPPRPSSFSSARWARSATRQMQMISWPALSARIKFLVFAAKIAAVHHTDAGFRRQRQRSALPRRSMFECRTGHSHESPEEVSLPGHYENRARRSRVTRLPMFRRCHGLGANGQRASASSDATGRTRLLLPWSGAPSAYTCGGPA